MSKNIWVYVDQFKGQAVQSSWEAVGAARMLADKLGGSVTALVFGSGVAGIAAQAFEYGADRALLSDDASLDDFRPEPYASLLSKLAGEHQPAVILFPTTSRSRELAAMAAVDLKTGILPEVTALEVNGERVEAQRPIYGGKLLATVICQSDPQIITLRGRSFAKPAAQAGRSGELVKVAPALAEAEITSKVSGYVRSEGGVSLGDAGVIVSGGRGVSNGGGQPPAGLDEKAAEIWRAQQGFKLLGELADVLGGAVGASRAAVDAGYIPYPHQVGQTGRVVSPDLYIACGISGAIQHLAGMRSSKVIVAITKDPEAPIFKLARFGVAGDLFEIVPALTAAFKAKLGK